MPAPLVTLQIMAKHDTAASAPLAGIIWIFYPADEKKSSPSMSILLKRLVPWPDTQNEIIGHWTRVQYLFLFDPFISHYRLIFWPVFSSENSDKFFDRGRRKTNIRNLAITVSHKFCP
jgi:hypothetical protein